MKMIVDSDEQIYITWPKVSCPADSVWCSETSDSFVASF